MNNFKNWVGLSIVWLIAVAPQTGAADLEERVNQLERLLNSQKVLNREQQFAQMQQDLQTLRGELEVVDHQIKQLEKQQQDMYLDIVRQIQPTPASNETKTTETEEVPDSVEATPDSAEEAPDSAKKTTPEPVIATVSDDKTDYQHAFSFLQQGQYEQAITAFKAQLAQYPQGKRAEDAHYWLAETYYTLKKYDTALNAFGQFLEKYPKSPKYAHAQLKIGYIYYELADYVAARSLLEQVKENHPDTATAHLAEERLQLMRKEGL